MKVVVIVVAFYLVLATANPLVKVPYYGSSCDVDTSCYDSSYDLRGLKISFSPKDAKRGQNVTISASGDLTKKVTGGSIKVVVKYSLFIFTITILDQSYDVCDLVSEIGKQCPLPAGPISGSVTTKIPNDAPPGKYHAEISGTDQSGGKLVCGQVTCHL